MTDVCIIGGGVIGSSIAYFLASDPEFDGKVTVFEKDPTYEFSTSARSMASIRQQFSTPQNIALSSYSYDFLTNLDQHLVVEGEVPDIQFRHVGYLFFCTEEQRESYDSLLALQHACGAEVERIEGAAALAERFPWANTEDLAFAHLGLSREGYFDGYAITRAFRRKAISLGVTYSAEEVTGIGREGDRVVNVKTGAGTYPAGAVVNAAGARARWVAEMAGIPDLPVSPKKRCVFYCETRAPVPQNVLVIDSSGTYFRSEGKGFNTGRSPAPGEPDPENTDFEVDYSQFEEHLWPTLAHRVPAFEAIKQVSAWGCHYAMSLLDANAILGPHLDVENFYFANGFSGHGMQQAPAVGRGLAEKIVHGHYKSIDLSDFGYQRIRDGKPMEETGVI